MGAQESTLVLRKMCSALIAYFLRPPGTWKQCIRHLIVSFKEGRAIPLDIMSTQQSSTSSVIRALDETQMQTVLWFASGLVEEVNKADNASIQTYKYYERVSSNVVDAVDLLQYSIQTAEEGSLKLAEQGVKCFQVCRSSSRPFSFFSIKNFLLGFAFGGRPGKACNYVGFAQRMLVAGVPCVLLNNISDTSFALRLFRWVVAFELLGYLSLKNLLIVLIQKTLCHFESLRDWKSERY